MNADVDVMSTRARAAVGLAPGLGTPALAAAGTMATSLPCFPCIGVGLGTAEAAQIGNHCRKEIATIGRAAVLRRAWNPSSV